MNVVTKPADKNLGLVPIRGDIYAAMLRKWLAPPSFQPVDNFPHQDILRRVENTIRYTRAISAEEKEQWIQHTTTQNAPCPFYAIPKIHKKQHLGSRPISAQHSYMLAPLSIALTKVLLPVQNRCIGITKDTVSFVNRIELFTTPRPFVFLTYDVEACYPSIDINDAIQTLHENIPIMREHNSFWTKVLQLIMYNNYVSYNDRIYRQMIGTATGTQVAPPFANLYLFYKFKTVLSDPAILFNERYIDDGFVLVSTEEDATRIVSNLNNRTNLTLTSDISDKEAIFLDLVIYKGDRFSLNQKLDLKTYFKPTNRLLYLPMVSHHPLPMKAGIIIGEAIRTLRNSSSKIEWLKALHFIFKGLLARGYKPKTIQRAWKKVRWEDRDKYIYERTAKDRPPGTLIFTRYNPLTRPHWIRLLAMYPFENIFIKKNSRINRKQADIFKLWPPTIVWSNFNKIGHRIISAKESWNYPKLGKRKAQGQEEQDRLLKKTKSN